MGTKTSSGGGDFMPCPAGNHAARICEVIFIGTVHSEYMGSAKDTPQIILRFEVPGELRDDGKPFTVSTMPLTYSVNKKASFRKLVQGLVALTPEMEKEFDYEILLGKEGLINVVHTPSKKDPTTVYTNIVSTSPLPKGMEVGPAVHKQFMFDVNTSDLVEVDSLPEFVQRLIKETPEYKNRVEQLAPADRPF